MIQDFSYILQLMILQIGKQSQLMLVCEMTLNGIDLHLFHESK